MVMLPKLGKIKRPIVFFVGLLLGMAVMQLYFPPEETVIKHDAEILVDQNYSAEVLDLIQNANKSIYAAEFEIKWYEKWPNSNPNLFLEALVDAHKRGVEVHLIADQFYSTPEAMDYLLENGVDAKWDSEGKTMHAKFLVIDGEIVVVGSTNWSHYSTTKNHEANAIIYSEKLAEEFIAYFYSLS